MSEYVFKSGYSVEKIESNFKNVDFFSGIEEGLKEAIAYERGNANARTFSRKRILPEINARLKCNRCNDTSGREC